MSRYTDGQEEIGNPLLQAARAGILLIRNLPDICVLCQHVFARRLQDALREHRKIKGLHHIVACAQIDSPGDEIIPAQRCQCDHRRRPAHFLKPLQHAVPIHLRHDHIAYQHIRLVFFDKT